MTDNLSSTALLLIDFQRDFCAPGGYADHCGGIEWVTPILPNAQRLLAAARRSRLMIVHTREGYAPNLSDCHPQKRERTRKAGGEVGTKGPLGRLLIRGEYGHDFIDELYPVEGELVVDKATYGAFCRTELEQQLRDRGITKLAICGVTADVCVHTTLREATDRGFDCLYVRDAISTFHPEVRASCERMVLEEGGIWGALTTSEELIARWESSIPPSAA
ncbi:MAG TPA: isochorismatase family cysteine hydrolase [Chthoniobacteraceae bacterium]|jgi:nicotinamidase-related amidase